MVMIMTKRGVVLVLGIFLLLLDAGTVTAANFFGKQSEPTIDPYKVLGVKRTASDADIQKAYRQKAKETHPDKNPSPNANDEFRRVTDAFEILGDPNNRRRYDYKMKKEQQRRQQYQRQEKARQQRSRKQWQQQQEARRRQQAREKDERQRGHVDMVKKAKATQGRVVKISTMKQLEDTMLDSSAAYKMHCLIMFVSNKNAESKGDEEFYFPYPFAGEPGVDNSYKNTVKIAKVRFNTQTELTKTFLAKSKQNHPHIIFARKGDAVWKFRTFQRKPNSINPHGDFKKWVESSLFVEAIVANGHALPVDVLIMRNDQVIHQVSLDPNYHTNLALKVGDRIVSFDKRLDTFPGATRVNGNLAHAKGAVLYDVPVTSDNTYTIPMRRCYDLSVKCESWTLTFQMKKNAQCDRNPEFMHHICPYTCGVCSEHFASDLSYLAFHYPAYRLPRFLRGAVHSGRVFLEDIRNILDLRKNAVFVFFGIGFLIPLNILVVQLDRIASSSQPPKPEIRKESQYTLVQIIMDTNMIMNAVSIGMGVNWMMTSPNHEMPSWLRNFQVDFLTIAKYPEVFGILLGIGVITSLYIKSLAISIKNGKIHSEGLFFLEALLTLIGAVFGGLAYMTSSNATKAYQWRTLWQYYKNATFGIVALGAIAGFTVMSLKRLTKPLWKPFWKLSFITILLSNLIVFGVIYGLASKDAYFKADLMHVIELRKNAALAFIFLGLLSGNAAVKLLWGIIGE